MNTPLTVLEARAILTAHERVIRQGNAWDMYEFTAWCKIVESARDRVEEYELKELEAELSRGDLEPDAGDCPSREDGAHCNCWWDGDACCSCGAAAMTAEEKVAQGME